MTEQNFSEENFEIVKRIANTRLVQIFGDLLEAVSCSERIPRQFLLQAEVIDVVADQLYGVRGDSEEETKALREFYALDWETKQQLWKKVFSEKRYS